MERCLSPPVCLEISHVCFVSECFSGIFLEKRKKMDVWLDRFKVVVAVWGWVLPVEAEVFGWGSNKSSTVTG